MKLDEVEQQLLQDVITKTYHINMIKQLRNPHYTKKITNMDKIKDLNKAIVVSGAV